MIFTMAHYSETFNNKIQRKDFNMYKIETVYYFREFPIRLTLDFSSKTLNLEESKKTYWRCSKKLVLLSRKALIYTWRSTVNSLIKDIYWLYGSKNKTHLYYLQDIHLTNKDIHSLKLKGWKIIFHTDEMGRWAGALILIPDNTDFNTKSVKRLKDQFYKQTWLQ